MEQITDILAVFFLGTILLLPVAALSSRFALKPLIELLRRHLPKEELEAQLAAQARRLDLLETELQTVHDSLRALASGAEFERRLAAGRKPQDRAG